MPWLFGSDQRLEVILIPTCLDFPPCHRGLSDYASSPSRRAIAYFRWLEKSIPDGTRQVPGLVPWSRCMELWVTRQFTDRLKDEGNVVLQSYQDNRFYFIPYDGVGSTPNNLRSPNTRLVKMEMKATTNPTAKCLNESFCQYFLAKSGTFSHECRILTTYSMARAVSRNLELNSGQRGVCCLWWQFPPLVGGWLGIRGLRLRWPGRRLLWCRFLQRRDIGRRGLRRASPVRGRLPFSRRWVETSCRRIGYRRGKWEGHARYYKTYLITGHPMISPISKGVFDSTFGEGFGSNSREITEKGLNIVFGLARSNSIHNSRLLISLPLSKTAYVKRLDQVGLMRWKLDRLNMIYLSLDNKSICFVTRCSI